VVALLYVTLLLGMVVSATVFGSLLRDFSQIHLIQIIQGVAAITMILNGIALWKQEIRNPALTAVDRPRLSFAEAFNGFLKAGRALRLLIALALGTAGFAMQDILLEPFGAEVFALDVGQTTWLTALLAAGTLLGFAYSARALTHGGDPCRVASLGTLVGVFAFAGVIFAPSLGSILLFRLATVCIGFGSGLFAVGMLTAAMELADRSASGLALGAWGAVQATAAGVAVAMSGGLRDGIGALAQSGQLGLALQQPATGYSFVYHTEILLLFATLVALGPLVRVAGQSALSGTRHFGLAHHPG
jgi:BCD family chlorophyll transporter-like MFS transporter